jgi:hypothetical protein
VAFSYLQPYLCLSLYVLLSICFQYISRTHSSVPSMLPCRAVNSIFLGFSYWCRVVPGIIFFLKFSTSPHPLHLSRSAFIGNARDLSVAIYSRSIHGVFLVTSFSLTLPVINLSLLLEMHFSLSEFLWDSSIHLRKSIDSISPYV